MLTPEVLTVVPKTNPPAPWIGGKRLLSAQIIGLIEGVPHRSYIEPFFGMGGVFFRRTRVPKAEVINDRSGEVFNFFRILQRHYPQLMDILRFQLASRQEFERLRASDPQGLTDLERAARFLYLQKLSFAGKVRGQSFGISKNSPSRFNISNLGTVLQSVHERLAGVIVENLDWLEILERYDSSTALFYLDPPYHGHEDDYGAGMFENDQFEKLADQLTRLKGRFVLSVNDDPFIRTTFNGFSMRELDVEYTACRSSRVRRKELLFLSP
ncbi:DNA adenine methylase [Peteryoungia aggregata LMG 23059]|uniref:site-specific DNA-methyltransferase (adenine-specific) n=1 Tax=Peteryoungia aggregata LMG 23059 TaxID=1368425 RepID=A0ABU0GDE7_9HYPH|nr:DNA adenine methylase [Peteryoungia aggregata]MDQ0423379.1 DNA adenine methylase [Peteryoungia aggregata LMG 23059]